MLHVLIEGGSGRVKKVFEGLGGSRGSMSVRLCQGRSGRVEEVPVGSWRMQEAEL